MSDLKMIEELLRERPCDFNGCLLCLRTEYMLDRWGHACNCPAKAKAVSC